MKHQSVQEAGVPQQVLGAKGRYQYYAQVEAFC
jgi:hypothetical protein